jgi:hypothetical protein
VAARAAWGAGAQTYRIKVKPYPDAGKSLTVQTKSRQTVRLVTRHADGEVDKDKTEKLNVEEEFTYTVLEKGKKQPRRYKKAYTTATLNGRKCAYQGRTVVFTLRGGKYTVKAEGKPALPPADLAELARRQRKRGFANAAPAAGEGGEGGRDVADWRQGGAGAAGQGPGVRHLVVQGDGQAGEGLQ